MAATHRNVNWSPVTFTISSVVSTILHVQDVQIDPRGRLLSGSGDADRVPSYKTLIYSDPQITVTTEDTTVQTTLKEGTRGQFSATHLDAENLSGSGALTYTLANAIISNSTKGGAYQQFGRGTITIESWSPDGVTPALTVALAP